MSRNILSFTAALAVVLAAPVSASPSPKDLTKKGADPNQKICKVERFVGSNHKNRICKTRSEWAQVADDTKQGLDSREFKGFSCSPGGSQFSPSVGQMAAGLPSVQVGCPGGS